MRLTPATVRRVTELVHAKIEDHLTLDEMAESAGLSAGYFSQMFRKSTGETPHQFVLRLRLERAKEMLRIDDGRVFDASIATARTTQAQVASTVMRAGSKRVCDAQSAHFLCCELRFTIAGSTNANTSLDSRPGSCKFLGLQTQTYSATLVGVCNVRPQF